MKWFKWANRSQIDNFQEPGIYYIALSDTDIAGQDFKYIKEIIYIGMTISKQGVQGRLNQFKRAMNKNDGVHGGAERVRFKHKDIEEFFKNVFIAVKSFPLSHTNEIADWRQKGECVKHEYVSFADYMERFGKLPEFNDMERSKKK